MKDPVVIVDRLTSIQFLQTVPPPGFKKREQKPSEMFLFPNVFRYVLWISYSEQLL